MKLNHFTPTFILLVTSAFSVFGSNRISIDLSYQSRIPAGKIEQTIVDAITKNADIINEVHIDVSFSELGNVGIKNIIQSILSIESNNKLCLDVIARMNRLTTEGASNVLAQILKRDKSKKIAKNEEKEDDIAENRMNERKDSHIIVLDLSWNNLHVENKGNKKFLSNIRKLLGNAALCPSELHFNRCSLGPAFCRFFGKGLINRFNDVNNTEAVSTGPLTLHLCGNPDIGDAGVAALAAAIRMTKDREKEIFSTLDLSACNVGDPGAEALSLALESHPNSINRLILSNNKISDAGACSIADSIILNSKSKIQHLELDNNPGIKNRGATTLAQIVSKGSVSFLSLRSCNIKAEGVKAFGECLKTLSKRENPPVDTINIDLSGNPLGVLKKKKESLKTKASAKTASYMNYIGKQIKSGLKDVGVHNVLGTNSLESDDDEEELMGEDAEELSDEPVRCGAKALASTIVLSEKESHENSIATKPSNKIKCKLGMRHCFFDHEAADALSATIIHANTHYGVDLVIDAELNHVWEDDMIRAVKGSDEYKLEIMAERYIEAMEAIRASEERIASVSAAITARSQRSQQSDTDDDSIHNLDAHDNFDEDYGYDDNFQYDDDY
eukprot:CAMPEP_0194165744 /NCGR_PEP_ID=MMETSP0154-20130528/1578_1 /TAXON_ID=1049557 /ORGANISM="Thalassiothrix antarctica, Strain L6-D1" /LENGTH=614 /DNA_ID=CAMNT_0038876263 /DNA_START=1 /DNA_END=1845 /DNA_ORIENTATION=+